MFILWMNTAKIEVEHAPYIYYLLTSTSNSASCPWKKLQLMNVGYSALKERIKFNSDKPLTGDEFDEFLKMKQQKGMYKTVFGGIKLDRPSCETCRYTASIKLPPGIPPGNYTLKAIGFSGDELAGQKSSDLTIIKTGMPKLMSTMAWQHPALYGIVAIITAMVAGLIMGVLFTKAKH